MLWVIRVFVMLLALLLCGCIASYKMIFLNNSGAELVWTSIPGEQTVLKPGAASDPIRIPFFGRHKENWLQLQSGGCHYAYAAPDLQKAHAASFRRFSRNVFMLKIDSDFALHLIDDAQEITEFGFPLAPTTHCDQGA